MSNYQLPWQQSGTHDEPLAVDFVSNIGDGFDATYSIASILARNSVRDTSNDLAKSDLIVIGGNLVAPKAAREEYRDRTIGPYKAAFWLANAREGLDNSSTSNIPIFSIPGRRDWSDNLHGYLRNFTTYKPPRSWGTGAKIYQTRSYFAVQLTNRWWMWGVDLGTDFEFDTPQMDYFNSTAATLPSDAQIVLCVSRTGWLDRGDETFEQIDKFIEDVLRENGRHAVRLILSGDESYYARASPADPQGPTLVVSGGGGAHMTSTYDVPDQVALDWRGTNNAVYTVQRLWPSRHESLRVAFLNWWRIPLRNPRIIYAFGLQYILLGLAAIGEFDGDGPADSILRLAEASYPSIASGQVEILERLIGSPAGWLAGAPLGAALLAFAVQHQGSITRAVTLTILQLVGHTYAVTLVLLVTGRLFISSQLDELGLGFISNVENSIAIFVQFMFIVTVVGGSFGAIVFSCYLAVSHLLPGKSDEMFAGLRSPHYKHFLRMTVSDVKIDIEAYGMRRVEELELRWTLGSPQVDGTIPELELIDAFQVHSDPA